MSVVPKVRGSDPSTARDAVIALDGVGKQFRSRRGSVTALEDVDLHVASGSFVSILGPSGCGKSTLLNIAAGLEKPSTGSVNVLGRAVTAPVTEVGVVFQQDLLMDWRTTIDNVLVQVVMRGWDAKAYRERATELLDVAGIRGFADRYPRELSGGMRQRVALCRALVHDPPALLMDEPFGALDAMTRDQLNLELSGLTAAGGKTVLFVTHSIEESVLLSDRVVVMSPRPGRILADVEVALARPRTLELKDEPEFGQYARQLRQILGRAGAYEGAL